METDPTYWRDRGLQSRRGLERIPLDLELALLADSSSVLSFHLCVNEVQEKISIDIILCVHEGRTRRDETPTSNLRTSRAIHHVEVMRYENLLGKSMCKLWQDGLCNVNEFN